MNESIGDGKCSNASSLCMDLTNLVIWAHTHGTICKQIPALEIVQHVGHASKDNSVLWICGGGHAYHWQCEKLYTRSREENEAAKKRRRSLSCEASAREGNLDEKTFRVTPSFEWGKDAVSRGSRRRSLGATQQKDSAVCVTHYGPSPSENLKAGKSMKSGFAEEHWFSVSAGKAQANSPKVKKESSKDLQIISDEEQCMSDTDDQEDGINQNVLSESPVMGGTAEADSQMHHSQNAALNKPTATQGPGCTPAGKLAPSLVRILKSPVSDQESLDSSFPRLGPPLHPAESVMEASRARTPSGLAMLKEHVMSVPASSADPEAQAESPASVTFFEFEATVDVQQELQLSPLEPSMTGTDFSEYVPDNPSEESETLGSGQAPHPSGSLNPESSNTEQAPEGRGVLKKTEKKKSRNSGDIKVFKDWLALHCPLETREVYDLPPQELDNYLASFYNSAKRQNGTDFSPCSLHFFQSSIERYLKDHSYKYSVVKGPEFRASQEALKLKHQHLSQKVREGAWSILENLTDEDVESLRKTGLLGKNHPQAFLHLMFTSIIRGFGACTHTQSRSLYWGQLVLKRNEGEQEYLEWKDNLNPELSNGGSGPRLFAKPHDPDNCPVKNYKEYTKRRPQDMLHDDDPLYLTPKPLCSVWDQVWYSRKPLTKAKMEKMLKIIIQQVKRPVKSKK